MTYKKSTIPFKHFKISKQIKLNLYINLRFINNICKKCKNFIY